MSKIKDIFVTFLITTILAYFANDYIEMKRYKEKKIVEDRYRKLDSLYYLEKEHSKAKEEYIFFVFDSLKNINAISTDITKEAIKELEDNKFEGTQNEKDSIYNILNSYKADSTTTTYTY